MYFSNVAFWLALLTPAGLPRTERAEIDPSALKLTAELVSDRPLPFQAARLRVTVENVAPKLLTGQLPLENIVRVVGVKRDGEKEFSPRHINLLTEIHERVHVVDRGPGTRDTPLTLGPGQRRAVTFPVGIHWGNPADVHPNGPAIPDLLFLDPGTYVLRCEYQYGSKPENGGPAKGGWYSPLSVFAEVKVEVDKPSEKDKPWVEALTKDPSLARMLLRPGSECTGEQADVLRGLIVKAPNSSYVKYAKLAIARYHMDGVGDQRYSPRVNWAMAADLLESSVTAREYDGFPFMPHIRLRLTEAAPAEYKARIRAHMSEFDPDALEWLNEVAPTMTPEQWAKFRNRPARKDEPKPPPGPEKPR